MLVALSSRSSPQYMHGHDKGRVDMAPMCHKGKPFGCGCHWQSTQDCAKIVKDCAQTALVCVATALVCCVFLLQLHALGVPAGHFTHVMFDEAGQAGEQ